MPLNTANVSNLVFLGTATEFSPLPDAVTEGLIAPAGYDYGESLSILTVLLSTGRLPLNKDTDTVEPISQPQIHLIHGPDNLGTEVGDRIARGIYRVLDSVLNNDTTRFNILAHSRGAVEAVLLAHEIERIQLLCRQETVDFSQITESPDGANQSWWSWIGATKDYTTYSQMKNGPLKKLFQDLIDRLHSDSAFSQQFREKIQQVQFNMYLIDPVPGGRVLPFTQWHDQRFMVIPENVRECIEVIYENERSRGFKVNLVEAVNPEITNITYIPLPGHHGTGSGNHLDQSRSLLKPETPEKQKLLKATPLIQQLMIKQMLLFLRRNGVIQFRTREEMKRDISQMHPAILDTIFDAETGQVHNDQALNMQILALYQTIHDQRAAFELLNGYTYATGAEGSRHVLGNPVRGRLVHGKKQYLETGLVHLQDIIPPVDEKYINHEHQFLTMGYSVYNEFDIQTTDTPAQRVKKLVTLMIEKSKQFSNPSSRTGSPSSDALVRLAVQPAATPEMYLECAQVHLSDLVADYLSGKYTRKERLNLLSAIVEQFANFQENLENIRSNSGPEGKTLFAEKVQKAFQTNLSNALQQKQKRLQDYYQQLRDRLQQTTQDLLRQLVEQIGDINTDFRDKLQKVKNSILSPGSFDVQAIELGDALEAILTTLVDELDQSSSKPHNYQDLGPMIQRFLSIMHTSLPDVQDASLSDLLLNASDDEFIQMALNTRVAVEGLLNKFSETIQWYTDVNAVTSDINSLVEDMQQLQATKIRLYDFTASDSDNADWRVISLDPEIQYLSQLPERYIQSMPSSEVEAELTDRRDNIMMRPEDDIEEPVLMVPGQDSETIIAELQQSNAELLAAMCRLETERDQMQINLNEVESQLFLNLDEWSAEKERLQTARDLFAQERDALSVFKQNVQSTIDVNEEFFKRLVTQQLLPLTIHYRDYLQELWDENVSHKKNRQWWALLETKLELFKILVNDLNKVNQPKKNPDDAQRNQHCVENFYWILDTHTEIKKHRDPHWARFVRNAFAVIAILATGILPGMLVLACLAREKNRSMAFWNSRGAGFFDTAQKYRECKISIAVDQRHNPHDVISPMVSPVS